MDTTAKHADQTARLAEILRNPAPDALRVLLGAQLADSDHLTPLVRTLAGWLARLTVPTTHITYASDITEYLTWCARTRQLPLDVREDDERRRIPEGIGPHTFTAYELHLRNLDAYSESSVVRKMSVVSSFYRYALTTEEICRSPRTGYSVRRPGPTGSRLTPDQLDALEHAATHPPRTIPAATRTRTPIILALLECGARPGEIREARMDHLDLTSVPPALNIPRPRRTDGKLPPPDRLALTDKAVTAIRADWAANGVPRHTDPIIRTASGGPMARRPFEETIHSLSLRAHLYPPTTGDEIRLAYRQQRAEGEIAIHDDPTDQHTGHTPDPADRAAVADWYADLRAAHHPDRANPGQTPDGAAPAR
jgi:integrase